MRSSIMADDTENDFNLTGFMSQAIELNFFFLPEINIFFNKMYESYFS